MPITTTITPGYRTTEFILSVISTFATLLVISGVITQDIADEAIKAIVPVVMAVANALQVFLYIYGRSKLKQVHAQIELAKVVSNGKDNGSVQPG